MRIAYYIFSDKITEEIARNELRCSREQYKNRCMDETVTNVKFLIKKYGGSGVIEHIDRDGCVFEVTPIKINSNNSKHKYNRHL